MKKLTINTDKKEYLPGDELKGELVLKLNKSLKHRALHVTAMGTEITRASYNDGEDRHHSTERREIIEYKNELKGEGVFQPGTHKFPFSFEIPPDAPPSFRGVKGRIEYEIKAWVDLPFAFDVKDSQDLIVYHKSPRYRKLKSPYLISSVAFPMTGIPDFSMLDTGEDRKHPAMLAALEKTFYRSGKDINCKVLVSNPGGKRIRKLIVRLRGTEQVKAQGMSDHSRLEDHFKVLELDSTAERHELEVCFSIPKGARSSLESQNCRFLWELKFELDVALGFDVGIKTDLRIHQSLTSARKTKKGHRRISCQK